MFFIYNYNISNGLNASGRVEIVKVYIDKYFY